MRCFIAIPLPKSVKQQLGNLQESIENLRWQNINQLHITLKFLGEVSDDKVQDLQAELRKVELSAFSISLKELGYFPKGKKPRVLWAGIEESKPLVKLKKKIEAICAVLNFEADNRPFKPHITLARMKGTSENDVMAFIKQHKQFDIQDVPVEEFVLYESRLHSDGAEHIQLKTFQLERTGSGMDKDNS